MNVLLFTLGALIVALTVYDFLKTAIGMAGLGPITRRVSAALWECARRYIPLLRARTGWRLEDAVGPGILTAVALTWISLNAIGYLLLFSSTGAVVQADTGEPSSIIQRLAFAGSAISTLGGSLAEPGNGWWDALSMIAAVNGMVVLTLSVSFVQGVIKVTADGRSLALQVTALHVKLNEMSHRAVLDRLADLSGAVALIVMELRSTPIVGYFSTQRSQINFPSAVIALVEMIEEYDRPPRNEDQIAKLIQLRMALRELGKIDTVGGPEQEVAALTLARKWAERRVIPAHENLGEGVVPQRSGTAPSKR